jgi:DNA-binding transcriptional regulator GbsR (MarR family)
MMKLSSDLQSLILTWAELASHWGLNRTEALIHSLLFIAPSPLTMEEIASTLNVARSNVSNSLKELLSWKIIKSINVLGDRRKHYAAYKDVWEMFRTVVSEQRRRELDPFINLVKETKSKLARAHARDPVDQHALEQMTQMVEFFETAMGWYAQLQAMPTSTIRQYMKLGGKFMKLYRGE